MCRRIVRKQGVDNPTPSGYDGAIQVTIAHNDTKHADSYTPKLLNKLPDHSNNAEDEDVPRPIGPEGKRRTIRHNIPSAVLLPIR